MGRQSAKNPVVTRTPKSNKGRRAGAPESQRATVRTTKPRPGSSANPPGFNAAVNAQTKINLGNYVQAAGANTRTAKKRQRGR